MIKYSSIKTIIDFKVSLVWLKYGYQIGIIITIRTIKTKTIE